MAYFSCAVLLSKKYDTMDAYSAAAVRLTDAVDVTL
jgi:hypothetical protein